MEEYGGESGSKKKEKISNFNYSPVCLLYVCSLKKRAESLKGKTENVLNAHNARNTTQTKYSLDARMKFTTFHVRGSCSTGLNRLTLALYVSPVLQLYPFRIWLLALSPFGCALLLLSATFLFLSLPYDRSFVPSFSQFTCMCASMWPRHIDFIFPTR